MSDTDDTDVLLLIPPDFFLIHTDSDDSYHEKTHGYCDPHCGVVDTLISQVNRLENRLNKIEVNSELSRFSSVSSCNSTLIPMSDMSENPYKNRDYHPSGSENYVPSSTKSTPQKPRNKFQVVSLPSTPSTEKPGSQKYRRPPRFTSRLTPRILQGAIKSQLKDQSIDADESSISASPEKMDNKRMLGEIDQFLNNVKTIQRVSTHKVDEETKSNTITDNPVLKLSDLKPDDEPDRRFSQMKLKDVDRLLEAMESQQKFMDLQDNQIESLYENTKFTNSQQSWQCGDTKGSVPDLGFGMRDILYSEESLPPAQEFVTKISKNELRDSKSDSQSNTETFQTVLHKHATVQKIMKTKSSPILQIPTKTQSNPVKSSAPGKPAVNEETDSSNEAYEMPRDDIEQILPNAVKSLPFNNNNMTLQISQPSSSISSINLFSLADIWNSNGTQDLKISDKEMKKLLPKLEEEKCRRKHCEKLIQELQMKILEMQQRLAVAVQVDCAKDEAILRFHEAWEKVANRWKNLESERNSLSQKLLSVEEKSSIELAEAAQKVVQYELEMSKALNIAHNNQEKCNHLETERADYLKKLADLKLDLNESQESLKEISREKDVLSGKINQLERESLHDKKLLLETQSEISKSKGAFLHCQNELTIIKDDYIKLENKIKDKQTIIHELECQKNNLQISLESMHKNEIKLQHQIKNLQEESERAKHELRNFYQQQVEALVKDKLKEFQEQLEQAEKSLQEELQTREQTIAKAAAKQLQKLADKHRLEIQLIEEKHKEEVRLYELQFTQMNQQISILQNRLESYHARRNTIAKELHNVMEQQWLEALRIINNSKSPFSGSPQPEAATQKTNDSSHDIQLAQLRNILSSKETEEQMHKIEEEQKFENNERYKVKLRSKNTITDLPFRSLPTEAYQTPISSKQKIESPQYSETELQKYIKLLLDKMPQNPSEKTYKEEKSQLSSHESSTSEFVDVASSWSRNPFQKGNEKSNVMISRELRSGKPPWK